MKILDEYEISHWAYQECKKGNNTSEIRNLITLDCYIVYYCKDVKDREEMWSKIKESYWKWVYCQILNICRFEISKRMDDMFCDSLERVDHVIIW